MSAFIGLLWVGVCVAAEDEASFVFDPNRRVEWLIPSIPHELQFGCARYCDRTENRLAHELARGGPDEKLAAARALWKGRCRTHAGDVLAFLNGPPPGGQAGLRAETLLALGSSGDERALEPLLELLADEDYVDAGFAASALGYLGRIEAEPKLIAALAVDKPWVQAKACQALGMIGTRRALPALDALAKSDRFTGAINLKGVAASAGERIRRRESDSP